MDSKPPTWFPVIPTAWYSHPFIAFLHYSSADQYDQEKVVEVMYIASKSQWLLSSVPSPCWITGSGGNQLPCCKQSYRETHSVKKWVLLQTASEDSSQQPAKWAILATALEATIKLQMTAAPADTLTGTLLEILGQKHTAKWFPNSWSSETEIIMVVLSHQVWSNFYM